MITTQRLLIRPVYQDKAENIASLITEKVSRWTSPIPWPYNVSDALSWVINTPDEKRLGIFLLNGEKMIGAISMPTANGDEAGFWINEKYEGKGYATEAAAAVIAHAFTNKSLDYLDSSVHRDNIGSKHVHEKLGFSVIAEEERHWPNKNAMVPVLVYRLSRNAWQSRPQN